MRLKLSRPKVITWWIAVVLGVLGILAILLPIPAFSAYAVWMIAAAFILLALATALRDL